MTPNADVVDDLVADACFVDFSDELLVFVFDVVGDYWVDAEGD